MEDTKNITDPSGAYHSTNPMFRSLTAEEVSEFRQNTRENYSVETPINPVWHPVYRDECRKINADMQSS